MELRLPKILKELTRILSILLQRDTMKPMLGASNMTIIKIMVEDRKNQFMDTIRITTIMIRIMIKTQNIIKITIRIMTKMQLTMKMQLTIKKPMMKKQQQLTTKLKPMSNPKKQQWMQKQPTIFQSGTLPSTQILKTMQQLKKKMPSTKSKTMLNPKWTQKPLTIYQLETQDMETILAKKTMQVMTKTMIKTTIKTTEIMLTLITTTTNRPMITIKTTTKELNTTNQINMVMKKIMELITIIIKIMIIIIIRMETRKRRNIQGIDF